MPIRETDVQIYEYPTSRLGVNINKNIVELNPEECIQAKNLVWSNGMIKRGGQYLVTDEEVVTSKKINGIHKYYKSDGTSQLLAACDTTIKYLNGTSWTSAITGLTTNLQTYMSTWGALDKTYICNGTDAMRSWDGSTEATIGIADGDGVPSMALPYQDRLLTIVNHSTKGGCLTWSASFSDSDWESISDCGVRPDVRLYGMTYHSVSNEQAGYDTKVLLAGANGMYLFAGKDLRVPFIDGDYSIFPLSVPVGCNAPRTMCWTPKGTIWLGINRQLYLLPFNSISPIAIGNKIRSNISGIDGINGISPSLIEKACAAYHNGYYILSIAASGGSNNTIQWWLNVDRAAFDEAGDFGPWYGPMTGQSIGCFCNQNGTADGGELVGGECDVTSEKGYVYYLNDDSVYGDIEISTGAAKEIPIGWQTFYNPLGNTYMRKDVHKAEIELLDVLGSVTVNFYDITGALSTSQSVSLSGTSTYWNDNYWDEAYWGGSTPARVSIDLSPAIHARRVSVLVEHNIANDTFELYAFRLAGIDQGQIFE